MAVLPFGSSIRSVQYCTADVEDEDGISQSGRSVGRVVLIFSALAPVGSELSAEGSE